jgi:hypothetical protein
MAPADRHGRSRNGATGERAEPPMTLARAQRLSGLAMDNTDLTPLITLLKTAPWLQKVGATPRLEAGELTRGRMEIPQGEAQTALRGVVRLVADLPRDTSPIVVWEDRGSELEVDTAATRLACKVGVVTIGISVRCDQVPGGAVLEVPLGVGTAERPTGLVMSALTHVAGPAVVVDRWSDALIAFAWECLVETARRLCELAGTDSTGRRLVPGAVGSGSRVLLIQPMSPFGPR